MNENNSFRKNPKNEDSNTNTIHIYSTDKEITPQEQFHQSRTNNYSHVPNSSNEINKEESCFTKNKTLFIIIGIILAIIIVGGIVALCIIITSKKDEPKKPDDPIIPPEYFDENIPTPINPIQKTLITLKLNFNLKQK